MNSTHLRSILLFSAFLLPSASIAAQMSQATSQFPSRQKLSALPLKQVIERHFESTQPIGRPQLGGVVPGVQLIQMHRTLAAALQQRMRVDGSLSPRATSGPAILPGLQTRPSLAGGSYPTAIVSGDFNTDGYQDFVVAMIPAL